jgi:hypothetical protein
MVVSRGMLLEVPQIFLPPDTPGPRRSVAHCGSGVFRQYDPRPFAFGVVREADRLHNGSL